MKIEQLKGLFLDEKTALEERFIKACVLVDKLKKPLGISQELQLQFYGLFKQGAFGPCATPQPSRLHMAKRELWKAWNEVKISKTEAQQAYIELGLKVIFAITGEKAGTLAKILDELTPESLLKFAIDKILITSPDIETGKPKNSVIEQAKQISKVEEIKSWTVIAERMKAKMLTTAPSPSLVVTPSPIITFSARGSAATAGTGSAFSIASLGAGTVGAGTVAGTSTIPSSSSSSEVRAETGSGAGTTTVVRGPIAGVIFSQKAKA